MHLVWASPGTAAAYRRDHRFPDGTVLVKEVLAGEHGRMTTGQAHWASDTTKVWFVMIKDAKGRYPGNPLWGDGWGWALFKGDAPDKQVATDYRKGCLGYRRTIRRQGPARSQAYIGAGGTRLAGDWIRCDERCAAQASDRRFIASVHSLDAVLGRAIFHAARSSDRTCRPAPVPAGRRVRRG
jgi:hypothetical protein